MSTATMTPDVRTDVVFQEEIVTRPGARYALAAGRIIIGFYFFWAFIDKTFGLGFSTPSENSWLNGGTPAQGYLSRVAGPAEDGSTGWFSGLMDFFLSWGAFADILFMAGLLGIGVAMLLGAGLRIAACAGTLLMIFMYMAALPLSGSNPILDSHWMEAILLIIAAATLSGDTWGVGKIWGRMVDNSWLR